MKPFGFVKQALASVLFFTGACGQVGPTVTSQDYDRAFSMTDGVLASKVKNADVVPHWIGDGEAFWYGREVTGGFQYRLVTSADGANKPLFDHAEIARALAIAIDEEVAADALPVWLTSYDPIEKSITAYYGQTEIKCSFGEIVECHSVETLSAAPGLLISPDGEQAAFVRDNNVWVRDLVSGAERPLTENGEPYFAWGKTPDTSLAAIPEKRYGIIKKPYMSVWSPDSTKLVVTRTDERNIGVFPYIEWAPVDGSVRPKLYQLRIPLMGDALVRSEYMVIDLRSGERGMIEPDDGYTIPPGGFISWSPDNERVYFIAQNYGLTGLRLLEYSNGSSRVVYEEASDHWVRPNHAIYNTPNIRLINNGKELLWFSEKTGWGHLYRIDVATGELLNSVTAGEWTVFDIIRTDDKRGRVYFTAAGREEGNDPYFRKLYHVDYDGSNLTLVTQQDADHNIDGEPSFLIRNVVDLPPQPERISPDGRYVMSSYSTMNEPPVSVLRNAEDGEIIAEIEAADVSELLEFGYRPAERFSALAADGKTTIYGSLYLPPDFDPKKSYPVINALYAGPQVKTAPIDFMEAFTGLSGQGNRAALASLGFAVVTIDGRGTPFRSFDFQSAGLGEAHGSVPLEDHRAALEQLAVDRPYIDLTRVGVVGHSWGGYHAVRAMLLQNDFYDAAIASAGVHNWDAIYPGFEPAVGMPDYGGGAVLRPTPDAVPENIAAVGNIRYADQLKGHLLLMFGDLDENVPPNQAVQMMNALIEAGKEFDVLYMPNQPHYYFGGRYDQFRAWNYFVEHVMGAEPPDYDLNATQQ